MTTHKYIAIIIGVITRSLYYLLYWQKKYVNQTDFSGIIGAAAGGAMVEVSMCLMT